MQYLSLYTVHTGVQEKEDLFIPFSIYPYHIYTNLYRMKFIL